MFVIQLSRDNKRHNMLLSFKPSSSSLNRSDSIITIPVMLLSCGSTHKTQDICRPDDKDMLCSELWPTTTRPRVISQTIHAFLVLVTYLASRVNRTTICIRYNNDQSQQGRLFHRAERCARASIRSSTELRGALVPLREVEQASGDHGRRPAMQWADE